MPDDVLRRFLPDPELVVGIALHAEAIGRGEGITGDLDLLKARQGEQPHRVRIVAKGDQILPPLPQQHAQWAKPHVPRQLPCLLAVRYDNPAFVQDGPAKLSDNRGIQASVQVGKWSDCLIRNPDMFSMLKLTIECHAMPCHARR